MNEIVLFFKPTTGMSGQNVVSDFVYGCWCNGRRIGGMQMPPLNEIYAAANEEDEFVNALPAGLRSNM